jgi:uncharacterized membrane protein HdeD (DUF308 family)
MKADLVFAPALRGSSFIPHPFMTVLALSLVLAAAAVVAGIICLAAG